MNIFKSEVLTQGAILNGCIEHYNAGENDKALSEIADNVKAGKYTKILFAGMGSSYYAPLTVSGYTTNNVLPSYVFCADELAVRQFKLVDDKTLVVAVSQSGESKETVMLADNARKITDVVAVVDNTSSSLAKAGTWVLPIYAGIERHISNKTYQCTLAVLVILGRYLAGVRGDDLYTDLFAAATWCSDYLAKLDEHGNEIYSFVRGAKMYDFFADGPSLATAKQSSLIYREGPNFYSGCMECQDYYHGWNRCADDKYVGIALMPGFIKGSIADHMISLVYADGGKCILMTDTDETPTEEGDLIVKLPHFADEVMSIVENIPANVLMAMMLDEFPGKPLPH